jgi:hypothetical protein
LANDELDDVRFRKDAHSFVGGLLMAYQVCEESLDRAQDEALALLKATRSGPIEAARYDWLYRNNPDGPAVLWSVRDTKSGEMAGFTVALPRRVLVDGKIQVCWNGADFSIYPKHRTLGTALKLRRAAKEGVDAGRAAFLYAHPNAKMQVIHEKVGHYAIGRMVRYATVLRSAGHLRRRFGRLVLPGVTGCVVDLAMRVSRAGWRHRPTCSTRVIHRPKFGDEFDRLFADAARQPPIVGVRDSRYLNWRYALNPLYETSAVLAEQNGKLAGYALYTVEDHVAHLKDLFTTGEAGIADDLLAALIEQGRKQRLVGVSAVLLDTHWLAPALQKFGFRERAETSLMFAYARENDEQKPQLLDSRAWLVSAGDRDV